MLKSKTVNKKTSLLLSFFFVLRNYKNYTILTIIYPSFLKYLPSRKIISSCSLSDFLRNPLASFLLCWDFHSQGKYLLFLNQNYEIEDATQLLLDLVLSWSIIFLPAL